jgi:hypothetical protein
MGSSRVYLNNCRQKGVTIIVTPFCLFVIVNDKIYMLDYITQNYQNVLTMELFLLE